MLSTINNILGVLTLALGGIAAISLLVGGIGIMNTMATPKAVFSQVKSLFGQFFWLFLFLLLSVSFSALPPPFALPV